MRLVMSSMMVLTYALLFLFDVVLLVLMLLVFAEKRRIRKDMSKLRDSESSVAELTRSMEHLIDEYKRVASRIQDDTSAKRDELMRSIQRADRLLMELVRRSDRFELAAESSEISSEKPPGIHQERKEADAPTRDRPAERVAAAKGPTLVRTTLERPRPVPGAEEGTPARPPSIAGSETPKAHRTHGESPGKRREAPTSVAGRRTPVSKIRPFVALAEKKEPQPSEVRSDEEEMQRTKKLVMDLSRQGLDVEAIARSLRVPVGQVKLILDVQKSKRS